MPESPITPCAARGRPVFVRTLLLHRSSGRPRFVPNAEWPRQPERLCRPERARLPVLLLLLLSLPAGSHGNGMTSRQIPADHPGPHLPKSPLPRPLRPQRPVVLYASRFSVHRFSPELQSTFSLSISFAQCFTLSSWRRIAARRHQRDLLLSIWNCSRGPVRSPSGSGPAFFL